MAEEEKDSFFRICMAMKNNRGIDFTYYKRTTVLKRVQQRMTENHCGSLAEYAEFLESSQEEVDILVKEMLIGVTSFFRDSGSFQKLKDSVLYPMVRNTEEGEPVRVWSAGCSTGEEAYSIAILFREILDELHVRRDIKIFATDINSQAVEEAERGVFPEKIADDLSPERLSRYFVKKDGQYHVSREIREMIIFATHNMLVDPPFGKMDFISCRNVMIYFQPVLQKELFSIFHAALKDGGFLFLGKSETASEYSGMFRPVCSGDRIYLHNRDGETGGLAQESPETREHLPSTTGELEMLNRELQVANEELMTANEELQSASGELESVNIEYQKKVDELAAVINDLSGSLFAARTGVLFVDGDLNIRKFTEFIRWEFRLMEQDVGRSIDIFAHSFPDEDIAGEARNVQKTSLPVERKVTAAGGQGYTLRIAPCSIMENRVKGLVLIISGSLETGRS